MTAKIYQFSEFHSPHKLEQSRKVRKSKSDYVLYNSKTKCFLVEEESKGIFIWSQNIDESLKFTKENGLLFLARLRWWYTDQTIRLKSLSDTTTVSELFPTAK